MRRAHVLIRLLLLMALGMLGWSSMYWVLYLGLPTVAALLVSAKGGERYLAENGPPIVRALRWFASAYAYLWLLTDEFPTSENAEAVDLRIPVAGAPTIGSALIRLVYSVPPMLLLVLLSTVAVMLWIVGALSILLRRRTPRLIAEFLTMTLEYQFRMVAYHLSLVERYPAINEPTEDIDARAAWRET
jgi:hypothetical protein